MVDEEVKKALVSGNKLVNTPALWTVVQTGARVLLGVALWLAWNKVGSEGQFAIERKCADVRRKPEPRAKKTELLHWRFRLPQT